MPDYTVLAKARVGFDLDPRERKFSREVLEASKDSLNDDYQDAICHSYQKATSQWDVGLKVFYELLAQRQLSDFQNVKYSQVRI